MRITASVAGSLLAVLALTSCAANVGAPESSSTPAQTAETREATPSPVPEVEAVEAPQECLDYVPNPPADTSAVGLAAAKADLPDGMVLNPGLQVIPSTEDPGKVEAVVRVCSGGVDRAALVAAGNSIAKAIYADPSRETLTLLMISSYTPTGDYLDRQPNLDVIQTDYELFLWDADAKSLGRNWE